MYHQYSAVAGSGALLRSIDCIPAVVRAALPCTRKKTDFSSCPEGSVENDR